MMTRSQRMPWGGEPGFSSGPELGRGDGLFVVEDLAVGEAGAVIECCVDVSVVDTTVAAVTIVAASVQPPPSRGPGQFRDVDMD